MVGPPHGTNSKMLVHLASSAETRNKTGYPAARVWRLWVASRAQGDVGDAAHFHSRRRLRQLS